MKILLVDISGLAYPIWHVSGNEPDQDYVSKATVARVHSEAHKYDHVVVCCDGPRNFRKDISPEYKANREKNEVVKHQLRLAQEQLEKDGFQVWRSDGFEADDLIASTVDYLRRNLPLETGADEVVILSSDKDLMACVGIGVKVQSATSGAVFDSDAVRQKFGVYPGQMTDLLCLMGDKSDNVPGVKDVGQKRGAELLNKYASLANLYSKLGDSCTALGLTPSMYTNLKEGLQNAELARKLITLRTDVELPFADIFKPRVSTTPPVEFEQEETMPLVHDEATGEVIGTTGPEEAQVIDMPKKKEAPSFEQSRAMVAVEWSQSLEPQTLSSAMTLAKAVAASKLFTKAYGSPEAVLMSIMAGRELGISTMAALRSIHIIEGKPSMSAGLMAALVLRAKSCKQFEIISRTNESATISIWREGWKEAKTITYSVDDARRAGLVKDGSGWVKNPADMCVARCQAIGARLGWPDILANVYLPDELGREEAA